MSNLEDLDIRSACVILERVAVKLRMDEHSKETTIASLAAALTLTEVASQILREEVEARSWASPPPEQCSEDADR